MSKSEQMLAAIQEQDLVLADRYFEQALTTDSEEELLDLAPFDILKIGLIAVAVPILCIGALVTTDNDGSILLLFLYTLMPSIQVITHLNHHASRYNAQELMADINLGLVYSTLILAGVLFLYVLISWFILWRKSRSQ